MNSPYTHHDKYRSEYSMDVAIACDVTASCVRIVFYDIALSRRIARSAAVFADINAENAATELAKHIFIAMREYGIPASAITKIGCCAPIDIAMAIEDELSPTDMFLRPDVEISVLPFVSAYAGGRFAAMIATVPPKEGTFVADLGSALNLAYFTEGRFEIATVQLSGAFDGTALSEGIAYEFGAIDEVYRDESGIVCYCVYGDEDSCGVSASAALDGICLMLEKDIIDEDGIMTDRDQFYIGEDHCLLQRDVRAVQTDKAKASAAIQCFLKRYPTPTEVYLTGDVTACKGVECLVQLGILPKELAENAHFSPVSAEQGIIDCLSDEAKLSALDKLISSAADVSNDILDDFDDLYITNLSF